MPVEIMAAVLGLALLDMLSPAIIGTTLYLLIRPHRLGILLGVYLGTVAIAYFALGVALMLGLGAVVQHVDSTTLAWGQGAIGAALVVGSYFIPDKAPDTSPILEQSLTVRSVVLLGIATWAVEFLSALPYLAAIGIMITADPPAAQWLTLLGAYVTIMVLPGILLYGASIVLGDRIRDRLERWRQQVSSGSRSTVRWIVGIAGALLVLGALPEEITITF